MEYFFGADCVTSSLIGRLETLNILPSCSPYLVTPDSLQVICTTNILKSKDVLEKYVKDLPPSIYPFLLQIAFEKNIIQYLKPIGPRPTLFETIDVLIEHWPFQELILREFLNFKPHERKYPSTYIAFDKRKKKFLCFIQDVVTQIVRSFMPWNNTRKKTQTLCKLNLTQLGRRIDEYVMTQLKSFGKKAQNSNMHSTRGSLELVCDFTLEDSLEDSKTFQEFLSFALPPLVKRESNLPLSVTFERITIMYDDFPESLVMSFLNILLDHEKPPSHLKINGYKISRGFFEYLGMKYSSLKGLAVVCYSRIPLDLSPLSNFNHLRQLDLSNTTCKDGWGILGQLPCDLNFLRMVSCQLKSSDFIFLLRHANSLLQVDLSGNWMAGADVYPALFEFISGLHNVEILALRDCRLNKIPQDSLISFIDIIATSCFKLEVLQLDENEFSTNLVSHISTYIIEKMSLRVLSLEIPSDFHISDKYEINVADNRVGGYDQYGEFITEDALSVLPGTIQGRKKSNGFSFRIVMGDLSYGRSDFFFAF